MIVLYYDTHDTHVRYENLNKIYKAVFQALRAEGRVDSIIFLPKSLELKDFSKKELLTLHEEVDNILRTIEREIETIKSAVVNITKVFLLKGTFIFISIPP